MLSRVDVDGKADALQEWKDAVGVDEAKRVSGRALTRGTAIHKLAEKYILGDVKWNRGVMPINLDIFSRVRIFLDHYLGMVYGIEYPLYSRILGVAGRADVVGQWGGADSVIDFKGSSRKKKVTDIRSYFVQAATYGMVFEELTGLMRLLGGHLPAVNIQRLVIVMCYEHDTPEFFDQPMSDWRELAVRVMGEGRERLGGRETWPLVSKSGASL